MLGVLLDATRYAAEGTGREGRAELLYYTYFGCQEIVEEDGHCVHCGAVVGIVGSDQLKGTGGVGEGYHGSILSFVEVS